MVEQLKVLILEDDQNDVELIKNEIRSSLKYEIVFKWVVTKNDFIKTLSEFQPDIILSDYNLPQLTGFHALEIAAEKSPLTPFIIVTGTLSEETAAHSILRGAWDYVVKERLHRLPRAIENALKLKLERQKVFIAQEEIKQIKKQTGIQIKLLYDAINHAPSSVVIIGNLGEILYVNSKFTEMTGIKSKDIVGKSTQILKQGRDNPEVFKTIWSTIQEGKEWRGELSHKKNNGEIFWVWINISPIKDENNNITHYVIIEHDISELKKKEHNLQTSENWYRALFGNTGTATCILEGDGTISLANPKFEELCGLAKDEIEGKKKWFEFVAKEDLVRMKKIHTDRIEKNKKEAPKQYEFAFVDSKGTIKNILLMVDVIKGTDKSIASLLDITFRKKMEEELIAGERKFRLITENISDLIAVVDLDGKRIYNSPSYSNLIGTPDSLVGTDSFSEIHPDDKERVRKIFNETVDTGKGRSIEYRLIDKDGNIHFIESKGDVIYDNKNRKSQVVIVSRDISERKIIESTLEAERILLRTVIDNIPDAIYVKDVKHRKVLVNKADLDNIGKIEVDVIGRTDYDLFPPEIADQTFKDDESVVKEGKLIRDKEEFLTNSRGKKQWLLTSKLPLYNKEGKITGLVGIGHDITENKKMVEELIAAKEKAEEMNKLKSIFLANMSHELRTPLVGLLGFSEVLASELTGEMKGYAEIIATSGERLLRTLSTILDYSKMEAGKIEVFNRDISLVDLLNNEIKLFTPVAKNNGISIVPEFEVDELSIFSDVKFLIEIVDNLIDNAVKFTDSGSIKIKLLKQNDEAVIKVVDSGIGIPKDKFSLIFEEFRQASEGDSRSFQGTGLGLTLVKKYVDILNGKIEVESEVGIGSIFTVRLPLTVKVDRAEESLAAGAEKETKIFALQNKKQKSLLLVEDEIINQMVIIKMLSKDYGVDTANSAQEALTAVRNKEYDAVLMDINLGIGLNGLDVAREIKKIPSYNLKPIIAITAYAMEKDKEEFLNSGCSHYLAKPFTQKQLRDILNDIFNDQ